MSKSVLKFRTSLPRKNLRPNVSRKRGEANFVSGFTKAYLTLIGGAGFGGQEFPLAGFGIADFVWLSWQKTPTEGTALSLEHLQQLVSKQRLSAFEMKLKDWRRGLIQAFRYRYFADRAILVLPPKAAMVAKENLPLFCRLGVGLWCFDSPSNRIQRLF